MPRTKKQSSEAAGLSLELERATGACCSCRVWGPNGFRICHRAYRVCAPEFEGEEKIHGAPSCM
jgi:hypothetical protein